MVVAALRSPEVRRACRPVVVGSRRALERVGWTPRLAPILDSGLAPGAPGRPDAASGRSGYEAFREAVRLASRRLIDGLVTAPISKDHWRRAGIRFTDHTTVLEDACGLPASMMLVAGRLRSVLVTRHVALRDVSRRLRLRDIVFAARSLERALRALGTSRPRLALCGLNPHAGEEGMLGPEEGRLLKPAAAAARREGLALSGPIAADAAWGMHAEGAFDGVVSLYHDQALIPLKVAARHGIVNWTVGLPLVRTSPGHGAAFDIAGRRKAKPDAFIQAALLAARVAAACLALGSLPAWAAEPRKDLSVTEIVDRANKVLRGDSSHGSLTMTIVTPTWTRKLKVEGWNHGRDKAFIVIHSPAKDKGNTTLRRKNEMWLWMPRVERVVKVPPTMMHSSWQGSDFTYEDIVKADSIAKDYDHKVLEKKREKDHDVYKIEATPKPDAPVVWGRVLFWAQVYDDGAILPLKEEDYSERGELMRIVQLSEIEPMEGRKVPTKMECLPQRKPGQKTTIKYHKIDFDIDLPDSFFSLERLQRSR